MVKWWINGTEGGFCASYVRECPITGPKGYKCLK